MSAVDHPDQKNSARTRGFILAVLAVSALALVAYFYFDSIADFLQSVARGKAGPAQVHIRY